MELTDRQREIASLQPLSEISLSAFRAWFVLGSFFNVGLLPTLIYGLLLNQWGSNLIWGSVYGLGWCLAAYATDIRSTAVLGIGLLWSVLIAPALIYSGSGWLWNTTGVRGRRIAMVLLFLSFCLAVPANLVLYLDQQSLHLPDLMLHSNAMY